MKCKHAEKGFGSLGINEYMIYLYPSVTFGLDSAVTKPAYQSYVLHSKQLRVSLDPIHPEFLKGHMLSPIYFSLTAAILIFIISILFSSGCGLVRYNG